MIFLNMHLLKEILIVIYLATFIYIEVPPGTLVTTAGLHASILEDHSLNTHQYFYAFRTGY